MYDRQLHHPRSLADCHTLLADCHTLLADCRSFNDDVSKNLKVIELLPP
jgi:hypothetical protein